MKEILNPNSSKQGECPSHVEHPLYPIIKEFGYTYSHSVYVDRVLHHCYKFGEHNVSTREYEDRPDSIWSTSVSCASGREWNGLGPAELRSHLRSKRIRYGLK